jgi:G2/mitotic-specific cyclin 3/4
MDAKVSFLLLSSKSYSLRKTALAWKKLQQSARVSRVHRSSPCSSRPNATIIDAMLIHTVHIQPQRPLRTLRVREDENVPPILQNAKTIHQRNKSSPALSTMLGGGGIKAAAKRTAFGDVSNTFNGPRPSKDDSIIPTKPGLQVAVKSIQVVQEKRSAAFLRPAQRPLSVSSLKGLLTGVTGVVVSDSTTSQTGANVGPVGNSANSRKVLTKRNTTIFKDPSLDTVQEVAIDPPSHYMTIGSTAVPSRPVSRPIPSLQPPTKEVTTSIEPVKEPRKPSSEMNQIELTESSIDTAATSSEIEATEAVKSDGIYIDEKGVLRIFDERIADLQEAERHVTVKSAKQVQCASTKLETQEMGAAKPSVPVHVLQPIVSRCPQSAPSEPEEYWDEDEEDNYDEEGYVTARSYRSKGENTTGGATTVLFPHANQKVKGEIAAAKELVEATRTAEEIEDECYDTSMVAEYGNEIFDYMKQLEVCPFIPLRILPC